MNTEKWEALLEHFTEWIEEPIHGAIAIIGVLTFIITFLIFISIAPGWLVLGAFVTLGFPFWLRILAQIKKGLKD
jgi:hypothetical protein